MVTGFSFKGGRPRCFAFFQDFQLCYLTSEDPNQQCIPHVEDYFECLHHNKEIKRAKLIAENANKLKAQQAQEKEQRDKRNKSMALNTILNRGTTSYDSNESN